jgi:hypothetical protein
MDIYTVASFRVAIAAYVISPVYDKTSLSPRSELVGADRPKKPCPDNEKIKWFPHEPPR